MGRGSLLVACLFTAVAVAVTVAGAKKEKRAHLRFYWHDTLTGPNPSSIRVVNPLANSSTAFGAVNMIDNPLTMGPDPGSEIVGRAQGLYGSAAQSEVSLLMAQNLAFTGGEYKGSTVTLLGRNPVFNAVREMAVVGGTGRFRFCRGYALVTTNKFDSATGNAVVEYNVYVLHY